MPTIYIDSQTQTTPNTPRGLIAFTGVANVTVTTGYSARGEITFVSTANGTGAREISARGEIEFESLANHSVDGSPDHYVSARGEIEFESSANANRLVRTNARGLIEFESSAGVATAEPETYEVQFIVDIVPETALETEVTAEEMTLFEEARMTIGPADSNPDDWVEIGFAQDWEYNEPENSASSELSLRLANPDQISSFSATTRVEFSIGQRVNDVWTGRAILIPNGEFRGSEHSIGQNQRAPLDAVRLNISSGQDEKLRKTALKDLILYDPGRETVDETTLEPILDVLGNFYYPEVDSIPSLSIHRIFREIFVDRCGFANYVTNIPDYGIVRYDCSMGESMYEALLGYIGMWDPVIYTEGNVLFIIDSTMSTPSGFPSGRPFAPVKYRSISNSSTSQKLNALLVTYIEMEADYDYITYKNDPEEVTTTGNTVVTIQRRHIEYRKFILPFVVQRTALDKETRTTEINGIVSEIAVDDLQYTGARLTKRTKSLTVRLPDNVTSTSSITVYALQLAEREVETYSYATHPFRPRQIYLKLKQAVKEGLIVEDSENRQFSENFKSPYHVAWRSGNVYEGMALYWGKLESRREKATPLRTGEVRVQVQETDELRNLPIASYSEERAGDIGLNGLSPSQNRCLVFDTENPTRTRDRIEQFNGGEVPLPLLIPLAERTIKIRGGDNGNLTLETIGFDPTLKRGSRIALQGRDEITGDPREMGDYLITSRRLVGQGYTILGTFNAKKV